MLDFPTIVRYLVVTFYYLAIGVLGVLSLFGIYILVSYGRTRLVVVVVSVIYIIALLSMVGASQITLQSI